MDMEERLALIRSVGEEILTEEELRQLLQTKKAPIAYDGFEPSGRVHIPQGILRAININKMTEAGCKFKMLVADWHAWANNKMGGDLEAIQRVGQYMIEIWRASGMDLDKVEFVWANELVKDDEYWKTVMNVARASTLNRILRCVQIMGRTEKDTLSAAQVIYPCMQAADIFYLKADITQLGMDQRKVNVLARETGPSLGFWKPVVVSHHMIMGLQKPPSGDLPPEERALAMKMSKSVPDSAIFMTDSEEDVKRKIAKAYCPERQVNENPIFEYYKYMIFELNKTVRIERPTKFGGTVEFASYGELEAAYAKGDVHPQDLKTAAAFYIDKMFDPVRKHFARNKKAAELLKFVESAKVTR